MDTKTIDVYNQLANEYDEETKDFWKRFPTTFIDTFSNLVQGKILDVGSGPGRDAEILTRKGLEVMCLDASASMIELTKAKGIESVLGDFTALPFQDNSFDGVWAYTSLLHVPKSEVHTPLSEIRRVLKNDGVFALGLIEGTEEMYRSSSGMQAERWFSYYTKIEVEELLKQHGFKIEYFEGFKPGSRNYLNFISKKVVR
jgi:ubiquinone/menaquinone biosynthesis C-methylase UbiE